MEYPAILSMTAESDTRVDPMHAKKMAALMQTEAANGQSRERPILLRIEPKAGHGAGKPVTKQIEEATDIYSFLFWQLGVTPCQDEISRINKRDICATYRRNGP